MHLYAPADVVDGVVQCALERLPCLRVGGWARELLLDKHMAGCHGVSALSRWCDHRRASYHPHVGHEVALDPRYLLLLEIRRGTLAGDDGEGATVAPPLRLDQDQDACERPGSVFFKHPRTRERKERAAPSPLLHRASPSPQLFATSVANWTPFAAADDPLL